MMNKKTRILSVGYLAFIALLFLSSALTGIAYEIASIFTFVIPVALCLVMTRGDGVEKRRFLRMDIEVVRSFLPLVFPTIAVTMIISYFTSLLIFVTTGQTNPVDMGDSFILALITHALMPAILEEALFRYLPLRLIAPHSPRAAIIISAFFFSLAHHSLFSIPYALVAGVILMLIDLATDSIIPSVVIHFVNNAVSVCLMFVSYHPVLVMLVYGVIILFTVASIAAIRGMRDEYETMLIVATDKGEKLQIVPEMILYAVLTLTVAVSNLF